MTAALGLALGERWSLAAAEDGREPRGWSVEPVARPPAPAAGLGPLDALAALGLACSALTVSDRLALWPEPGKLTGHRVLPVDVGVEGFACERISWRRLMHRDHPVSLLRRIAGDALGALIARLEQTAGRPLVPCGSVTVSVGPGQSSDLLAAIDDALLERLGVRPSFLWEPTALAGWTLGGEDVLDALHAGEQILVRAEGGERASLVRVRREEDAVRTAYVADGDEEAWSVSPPGGGPDRAAWAAGGAAIWGRCGERFGWRLEEDESFTPVVRTSLLSDRREELVPVALSAGRREGAKTWAIGLSLAPDCIGRVPLYLCASLPWCDTPHLIRSYFFPDRDLEYQWRHRLGLVVARSAPGAALRVDLVGACGRKRVEDTAHLLPGPRRVPAPQEPMPEAAPTVPDDEPLTTAFAPLPYPVEHPWKFHEEADILFAPRRPPLTPLGPQGTVDVEVLSFTGAAKTLAFSSPSGWKAVRSGLTAKPLGRGLVLHSARFEAPGEEREEPIPRLRLEWAATEPRGEKWTKVDPEGPKEVRAEGALDVLPGDWGLEADLVWSPQPVDVSYPVSVGFPLRDGEVTARPAAIGVTAPAAEEEPYAAAPPRGDLFLLNRGDHRLRLTFLPSPGLRLWRGGLELDPGERARIPVERRRGSDTGSALELRDASLACLVVPVRDGVALGPAVPRPVQVRGGRTGGAVEILPAQPDVEWELRSHLTRGEWKLGLRVHGSAAGAAKIYPAGRPELAVSALIPPGQDGPDGSRPVEVELDLAPHELLDWFHGDLDGFGGVLEVLSEGIDAGEEGDPVTAIASRCAFRARIDGLLFTARAHRVEAPAGERVGHPLECLSTVPVDEELLPMLLWGERGAPYLLSARISKISRGAGATCDCEPRLAEETVVASRESRHSFTLDLIPRDATGWEQGDYPAELLLETQEEGGSRTLDRVPVLYRVSAQEPRVALRFLRGGAVRGPIRFRLVVKNVNPRSSLTLRRVRIETTFTRAFFPVWRPPPIEYDLGEDGKTIPSGQAVGFAGKLEPGSLLGRLGAFLASSFRCVLDLEASGDRTRGDGRLWSREPRGRIERREKA